MARLVQRPAQRAAQAAPSLGATIVRRPEPRAQVPDRAAAAPHAWRYTRRRFTSAGMGGGMPSGAVTPNGQGQPAQRRGHLGRLQVLRQVGQQQRARRVVEQADRGSPCRRAPPLPPGRRPGRGATAPISWSMRTPLPAHLAAPAQARYRPRCPPPGRPAAIPSGTSSEQYWGRPDGGCGPAALAPPSSPR